MKDYNEMAKAVFERRDEFVAKRQQRRATLLKAGVPVCALALVCLLSVTLRFDKLPEIPIAPTRPVSATENTEITEITENTANQNTGEDITSPQNTDSVQNNPDPTEPKATKPEAERPTEDTNDRPTGTAPDGDDSPPAPTEATTPDVDPTEPPWELPTDSPVVDEPGPNGRPDDPYLPQPTEPMYPDPTEPDCPNPGYPGEPPTQTPMEPSDPTELPTEGWIPNDTGSSEPGASGEQNPPKPTEPSENMTDPTEPDVTEPETVVPTEEPTEPRSTGPLEVTLGDKTYTVQTGDMITYTAELYVAEVLNKIEYSLNYGDELKPVDLRDYSFTSEQRMKAYMPNLDVPYAKLSFDIADVYNKGNRKIVMSDFGFREPKDFTQKKILVTFSFIAQYAGSTEIDLKITQMNSDNEAYFTSWGEQLIFEGISIDEYAEVTPAAEIVYPVAPELPYEVFEDDTPFTYPEESEEGELHINCDGRTYSANVGDTFTYVVEMKVYELFEDIQLKLNFDNSLVEMVKPTRGKPTSMSEAFPNVEGICVGCHPKVLRMNAVYLDGIDFRKRKVLMTVEFTVLKGGNLNLDMIVEELHLVSNYACFTDSEQMSYSDVEIYEYVLIN